MKKVFIGIGLIVLGYIARAQQAPTAGMIGVSLDHTHCSLSASNLGYCFATDGIWRQVAGDAAPVRVDVPAQLPAGVVTSVNGLAGPTVSLGYSNLTTKPTGLKCSNSDQNNTGLTASNCAIN